MGHGNHPHRPKKNVEKRELRYADPDAGETYARCRESLGGGRLKLKTNEGDEVIARVRGSMYKRTWINRFDLVLIVRRELGGSEGADKFDIVHKYSLGEERLLMRYKELSKKIHSSAEDDANSDDDNDIIFEDDDGIETI